MILRSTVLPFRSPAKYARHSMLVSDPPEDKLIHPPSEKSSSRKLGFRRTDPRKQGHEVEAIRGR